MFFKKRESCKYLAHYREHKDNDIVKATPRLTLRNSD